MSDLRRIIRAVNLEGKRVEREYGVSIPQDLCLSYLNEQPDYIASMKEIKDALQLNPSTTTGIVQRLERNGFVAKLPKSHDKIVERLDGLSSADFQRLKTSFDTIIEFLEIERVDAAPIVTAETEFHQPSGLLGDE